MLGDAATALGALVPAASADTIAAVLTAVNGDVNAAAELLLSAASQPDEGACRRAEAPDQEDPAAIKEAEELAAALKLSLQADEPPPEDDLRQKVSELLDAGQERRERGDLKGAMECFERCRSTAEQLRSARDRKRGIASAIGSIGSVLTLLGEDRRAEAHLRDAIAMSRALWDEIGMGWHTGNLAQLYAMQSRNDEALSLHREVLALSRSTGDRHNEAAALSSVGSACFQVGQHAEALDYLRRAIALSRELGERADDARAAGARAGQAGSHSRLCEALTALGHLEEAVEEARSARTAYAAACTFAST